MHATLIAEIPSAEAFAVASREWLAGALEEVFPGLGEALRTRPVAKLRPGAVRDTFGAPWGEPGHVLGKLGTYREHPVSRGREVLYSARTWKEFLLALGGYPWAARIVMTPLDGQGRAPGYPPAEVRVARNPWVPAQTMFTFSAPAEDTGWPQSARMQGVWAEFVKRQGARIGATAGSMTDDIGPGLSALQRTTHNGGPVLTASPDVLHGYTWVTVVGAELAERLGGAYALTATDAFHEISELPNGAIWLRATPAINEFRGEQVRMVFEALAPILLTGVAKFEFGEEYRIVEGADAARYQ